MDCTHFLQWAMPQLGLRWDGFRRNRAQVCKRLQRRLHELGVASLDAYRERLERDEEEWARLQALCIVTISRFYRDGALWDRLRLEVLPRLAAAAEASGVPALRCWCLGCASGEEPYTLSMVWQLELQARHPALRIEIVATDADAVVLERAARAVYPTGSLRELPQAWRAAAFECAGETCSLKRHFVAPVTFRHEDVRSRMPDGPWSLVLCRNVVFTYFDVASQRRVLGGIAERLVPGGVLVVGKGESVPALEGLSPWAPDLGIYRRPAGPDELG